MIFPLSKQILVTILFLIITITTATQAKYHTIDVKSPNLYPESITYDPLNQHFLVGSHHDRIIVSVSDAGVTETFVSDPDLPINSTFFGLAVDRHHNRLLAVVHSLKPLPPYNALVAYDLQSRKRLYLSVLDGEIDGVRQIANDVAVDFNGIAYVTNSVNNFIWKVNDKGEASIFSQSKLFTSHPVHRDAWYSFCGLNGIAYVSKGYLLVVQTNTGKMFKVDVADGTARDVLLTEELTAPDGIALRSDGVLVVVSSNKIRFVKSDDSWSEGVVYDGNALEEERFPTAVTVGRDDRVYVLYGYLMEAVKGNFGRELFGIEEIRSEKENSEEKVWVYVLIGLGLAYFMFWRFQMKQLVQNVNKKTR